MYSPRIDEALIPRLYIIAKRLNKPMTALVNNILTDALARYEYRLLAHTKEGIKLEADK